MSCLPINPDIAAMTTILLQGYLLVAVLLIILYWIQRRTTNAAIADAGWTSGLAILTIWFAARIADPSPRNVLIAGLAVAWAARLTYHVLRHRVIGKPEDGRYAAMRTYWGHRASLHFFWFFQGQAVVAFLFSIPILIALLAPRPEFAVWDAMGVVIWLIAVLGETIADIQLERFRARNKGVTCRIGLWRYSRHPNYFFEWIHWFAYVAFAIGHPLAYVTWLGPVIMLIFLFKVTGIPYTEKQALKSRGDDYREYQRTTSVFVPWPPRPQTGEAE